MIKTISITAVSLAALLAGFSAYADPPEFYVGAGYGQYKVEFDSDVDTDFEDDQEALNIYFGGKFTEALGAEIKLYEFDEASDSNLVADLEGASIAGIFSAPIWEERFHIYGKVGWFFWESEVEASPISGVAVTEDFEGDDLFYGVGVKFGLGEVVDLRFEYDRFELDDRIEADLDYISGNIQFSF